MDTINNTAPEPTTDDSVLSPELAELFVSILLEKLKPAISLANSIEENAIYKNQLTTSKYVEEHNKYVIDAYALQKFSLLEFDPIKDTVDDMLSKIELRELDKYTVTYLNSTSGLLRDLDSGLYYYNGPANDLPLKYNVGVFLEHIRYDITDSGMHGYFFKQYLYNNPRSDKDLNMGTYMRTGTMINNIENCNPWVRVHDDLSFAVGSSDEITLNEHNKNIAIKY